VERMQEMPRPCIRSGIRICIPLGSATCTWCGPKEEHFRNLVTVTPVMRMMSIVDGGGAQNMASVRVLCRSPTLPTSTDFELGLAWPLG